MHKVLVIRVQPWRKFPAPSLDWVDFGHSRADLCGTPKRGVIYDNSISVLSGIDPI